MTERKMQTQTNLKWRSQQTVFQTEETLSPTKESEQFNLSKSAKFLRACITLSGKNLGQNPSRLWKKHTSIKCEQVKKVTLLQEFACFNFYNTSSNFIRKRQKLTYSKSSNFDVFESNIAFSSEQQQTTVSRDGVMLLDLTKFKTQPCHV